MTEIEKLKKEIEDLKLIIESKNNQVESKNKHIKRLERIISNMKKEQSQQQPRGRSAPELTSSKFQNLPFLITSSPWISKRELLAIPQGCGTNNFDFIFYMVYK